MFLNELDFTIKELPLLGTPGLKKVDF